MQNFIKLFHTVQEIGRVSFFAEFGPWQSPRRPMTKCIWQSLRLVLVNINVHEKFYQSISYGTRVMCNSHFFTICTSAKPRLMENRIWLELVNIYVFAKFHTVQVIGPVSHFQNLDLSKASTNDKWHLAIPWARSCQYQ